MTRPLKHALTILVLSIIMLGARGAAADKLTAPSLVVAPFLYPPYPGTASQGSIFDHSSPNYVFDNRAVAFTGDVATKNCPSPAPPPSTPRDFFNAISLSGVPGAAPPLG